MMHHLRAAPLLLIVTLVACATAQDTPTHSITPAQHTSQATPPRTPPASTSPRTLTDDDLDKLAWRSVGPANMGGRVAALAIAPGNPKTFFVGYATGGLWKTTNNATTFSPVFDDQHTASIGAVAVADAPESWQGWSLMDDPPARSERAEKGKAMIVWVGTGEGNGRNSSSWGNGMYRSTDGGSTWTHLGLEDSHDIPAIAVHPQDPDTCYVAALGHLWGFNDTRGVYKTTDAGQTWNRVLYIDDKTGACDVLIDPNNPSTIYAAMYMRFRSIGSSYSGGPEGGIYKSTDDGATWTKLTSGLPPQTGRIGLTIYPQNSAILYATVESDSGGGKIKDEWTNRSRAGGVFRTDDAGASWTRTSDFNPRAFYFSRIRVDPQDVDRVYLLGWYIYFSDDGGKTFRPGAQVAHVDYHAMVINPDDPDHILAGCDGGLYVSWDKGETWEHNNHMAVGQFYNITVDDSIPYRIGGGLQDNGTWIGPSRTHFFDDGEFMGRKGAITNADWAFVLGGDGFHVQFDPEDPNTIYAEWQGGNISRMNMATGEYRIFKPAPKEGEGRYRFNWNAPFFISPHDPSVLYHAGNFVFKLTERGEKWQRISEDLTARDIDVIIAVGSDAETAGTVVSLAESPVRAGVLWAGSDDGRIHVSPDDGTSWIDVTPDEVNGYYVSKLEPSHSNWAHAYAAIDGHRSDHFEPILLMTEDMGRTWTDISGDLPRTAPTKVVREDPRNPDVLYVGTEHACYVTIDRGAHWVKLNGDTLPTVAVDDLAIQKREFDLVAGTHGRSVYILDDISAVAQLNQGVLDSPLHAFAPRDARPWHTLSYGALWSDKMFIAQNPEMGAVIQYWLRDYADEEVSITVDNEHDHTVIELTGTNAPGINRVVWDLQPDKKQRLGNPHNEKEFVPPGTYTITITQGDESDEATLNVLEP